MKVSRTVEMKFDRIYLGYGYCEIKDGDDNEVRINMTDDQILEAADCFIRRRDRILSERVNEALNASKEESDE